MVSDSTEVLIVGAGPTGLIMACQLAEHGIRFRIIDKNADHTTQSRALVLQARSLEIFNQMGIAQQAVAQGQVASALGAFAKRKRPAKIHLKGGADDITKFPYLLMLEQSKTEQILTDFLSTRGHVVERQTELIGIRQQSGNITATVRDKHQQLTQIQARYVIGADGAHSIVRQQLDIPFIGNTYPQSLFVLDCRLHANFPDDEMYLSFSDKGITGIFPMVNGRYRVLGTVPRSIEGKDHITFQDVENDFDGRVPVPIKLYDPQWISMYHAHHRYAATFQKDNCFLAGDAAHIHSPVGGQGMNTGLQDAYNLAWKLAFVMKNIAKPQLLNTYTAERITIAKNIVYSTDRVFHLVTGRKGLTKAIREYIIPLVLPVAFLFIDKLTSLRRYMFKMISETGLNYCNSSLSRHASLGSFPVRAPKPGHRLPYILYGNDEQLNIQDAVNGKSFQLLHFSADPVPAQMANVVARYKEAITITNLSPADKTKNLYEKLGIKDYGYYLIRPDMYIAYRSLKPDANHFENYLSRFLC